MEVAINNSELTTLSSSNNNNSNAAATSNSASSISNTNNKCSTFSSSSNNNIAPNGHSNSLLLNDTTSSSSLSSTTSQSQVKLLNNIECEINNTANVLVSNVTVAAAAPVAVYPNASLTANVSISNRTFRTSNGRPRKPGSNYVFKEENIQSYTDANGVVYKVTGNNLRKSQLFFYFTINPISTHSFLFKNFK